MGVFPHLVHLGVRPCWGVPLLCSVWPGWEASLLFSAGPGDLCYQDAWRPHPQSTESSQAPWLPARACSLPASSSPCSLASSFLLTLGLWGLLGLDSFSSAWAGHELQPLPGGFFTSPRPAPPKVGAGPCHLLPDFSPLVQATNAPGPPQLLPCALFTSLLVYGGQLSSSCELWLPSRGGWEWGRGRNIFQRHRCDYLVSWLQCCPLFSG